MEKKQNSELQKNLARGSSIFGSVGMRAVVFSVFVVLMVTLYYQFRGDEEDNPVIRKYGMPVMVQAYPGMSEGEINTLLDETWSRPYVYEPFTQFRESTFTGKYVNVDKNGFRYTLNQGPWPPDPGVFNIFMFGGSTAFGYGVADVETIASYLQDYLAGAVLQDINIYNFGRGHYYSTQELILYEMLLSSGQVPQLAIFIDGLNEFYYTEDEMLFTGKIQEYFRRENTPRFERYKSRLQKKAVSLLNLGADNEKARSKKTSQEAYNDPVVIERVIQRYMHNKKLIEAVSITFDVETLFVWQPVPTYKLDQQQHLFASDDYGNHTYSKYGYIRMAEYIETNPQGKNFLWAADMHQGKKGPYYVDAVHYSAGFSKDIAATIGDMLVKEYPLLADQRE